MLVALPSPALPARRKAGQPTRTLQQQEEQMATRSPQLCSFSLPLPSPEAFYVVRASGPTLVASTTVRGGAAPWPAALQMLETDSRDPAHFRAHAPLQLRTPGTYLIEVTEVFPSRAAVLRSPRTTCMSPRFSTPVLLARLELDADACRAANGTDVAATEAVRQWTWRPSPDAQHAARIERLRYQDCSALPADVRTTLGKPKDLVQFNLVGGLVYRKAANFTEANTAGRMGSYAWELGEPLSTRPDRPGRAAHPRAGSVCVVGGSHARNLCKWGAGLRSACAFPRNYFELRYARDVAGPAGVGNMTRLASCGTIVLHLGQWDLGWPGPGLTPLDAFANDFDAALAFLRRLQRPLLVLSTNYNPLNCITSMCPPMDWRSPPLIEEVNARMRAAAERHTVAFVDNSDLMAPLWDRSDDWCHVGGVLLDAQAQRVAERVCALPQHTCA